MQPAELAPAGSQTAENRRVGVLLGRGGMAWNVKGTYLETCSCEFFCPCNFSFAHGADYDRCRVTLVFNITAGDVEGTDVGGLVVALVADTPKVMTERATGASACSSTTRRRTSRPTNWRGCSAERSADRWRGWHR